MPRFGHGGKKHACYCCTTPCPSAPIVLKIGWLVNPIPIQRLGANPVNFISCKIVIKSFLVTLKEIFHQLNFVWQCRRYGLGLWQCPQFLFLVMGIFIGLSAIVSFIIGTRYVADPALVALIVLVISALLLIISFLIVQSFERLAEANRMKSEFISVVSHQLRGPLSNLSWVIETLMSGRFGRIAERQTEYFQILKENAGRMKELVSDLLTVSKIEVAELPLRQEIFSLEELIRDLINGFKPFSRASNVEIILESERELPRVTADQAQIRQVVENLIDNAIRYCQPAKTTDSQRISAKGRVKIRLTKEGRWVRFEIEDNGIGVPQADQKYIFQKFFRAANILRHQTQGSGLGLFIAKAIIERSKGKIGFSSKEGKGSVFWFTLPIKQGWMVRSGLTAQPSKRSQ